MFDTQAPTVGIIDIGSNSVRLVVYRQERQIWRSIINEKALVRLGEGVATSGAIQPERMHECLQTIRRFTQLLDGLNPTSVTAIATSAVRDADNGPELVRDISKLLGEEPQVLSGELEARYAAEGIRWGVPGATGFGGDLGGSSLEIMALTPNGVADATSLPVGPIRLFDMFPGQRKAAKTYIDTQIKGLPALDKMQSQPLFLVGGAWRALAVSHMRETNYPLNIVHRYQPPLASLGKYLRAISHMDADQAQLLEFVNAGRRMSLPFAALILRRLIKWSQCSSVEFSSAGVREGALSLQIDALGLKKPYAGSVALRAVRSLVPMGGRLGPVGEQISAHVLPLAESGYSGLDALDPQRLLEACHLADLGWDEHPSYKKSQTHDEILHSAVLPHNHAQRAVLAAIQFFRHKGRSAAFATSDAQPLVTPAQIQAAKVAGRLIHLIMQLSRGKRDMIEALELGVADGALLIKVPGHWPDLTASSISSSTRALSDATGARVRITSA